MSASICVLLRKSLLPTVGEWNAAVKAAGFDLAMDPFNLEKDSGYRPAILFGEESGFEWYLSQIDYSAESAELLAKARAADCDIEASLCFGSRGDEATAAAIAAAVLTQLTGGFYLDAETSNELLADDSAIAAAKTILREWRKTSVSPAKFISTATTSVIAPMLLPRGFVRVRPLDFARINGGIVQNFWIDKRDSDFRGGWAGQSLYPLREFLSGHFSPLGLRIDDWHEAIDGEKTESGMRTLADAFLEHIYPWFEETKTDSDFLDYLLEFETPSHHLFFDIACLQARLGRIDDAVNNLNRAIVQYEEDGRDWCAACVARCRMLMDAARAGTARELLENWKIQSIQNLGFKKLLEAPAKALKGPPPLPPAIRPGNLRTAALFSREIVRPVIDVMIQRTFPDFQKIEVRGPDSIFRRLGTERLFDFIIVTRNWSGAFTIELGSSYDANWTGDQKTLLACSIGLANVRLGLNRRQLASNHAAWLQSWYRYGRSESDVYRQILQARDHLARHSPPFFIAARNIMQSRKLLQFGLMELIKHPLTSPEKATLRKELADRPDNAAKSPGNSRFVELRNLLEQFATGQPDLPPDEKSSVYGLAASLLLADLGPESLSPDKQPRKKNPWNWFRK